MGNESRRICGLIHNGRKGSEKILGGWGTRCTNGHAYNAFPVQIIRENKNGRAWFMQSAGALMGVAGPEGPCRNLHKGSSFLVDSFGRVTYSPLESAIQITA